MVEELLRAALRAVEPGAAVHRALRREDDALLVDGRRYELDRYRRIIVVGAGKATASMAQAVEEILGDRLTTGLVAVKPGYTAPLRKIQIREAGHPIPDRRGVAAARGIAALLASAGAQDLVIALISGGASALLTLPVPGLALGDKRRVTHLLLRSGASIMEVNAVRKHLSAIKGGNFARLARQSTMVALILSDVVGSPLDVIASGPTAPDPTTFDEARAVLARYHLWQKVPARVRQHIDRGIAGDVPETAKPGDPIFARVQNVVIGSNRLAAEAAVRAAQEDGMHSLLLSTYIEGEAREAGKLLAGIGKEIVDSGQPLRLPACIVAGGETTVTMRGRGYGGRNQELALAAAIQFRGWPNLALACIATDGTDGPTDAAGAYADGSTIERARTIGLDANAALADNDSNRFFSALGDLIVTGPTNTNVNDLIFLMAFE